MVKTSENGLVLRTSEVIVMMQPCPSLRGLVVWFGRQELKLYQWTFLLEQ